MTHVSDRLRMEYLMARVADWCTAYHFFPLVKAKWLASPRLRTISFDAKLFCPWNVVNLTLLMEYKRKWHMPHLPYLFKRKSLLWTSLSSLCLGWNTFLITQIRTVKEGKDYGLQRLSCSDSSVLVLSTLTVNARIHTWSMQSFPNFSDLNS